MTKYSLLDASNNPVGPFSLDEIHLKIDAGELPANPMIAPEGDNQWRPLVGDGVSPVDRVENFLPGAVAVFLRWFGRIMAPPVLNGSLQAARGVGGYNVLAGAALLLGNAIYYAIKFRSLSTFLSGLLLVVFLVVGQLIARRFLASNELLLSRSPVRRPSAAVIECAALLSLFATVSSLVTAVFICVQVESAMPLLPAGLLAVFWLFFAAVVLSPELLNAQNVPVRSAGEEAVDLITFFLRVIIKLLPLYVIALSAIGVLSIVLGFFNLADPLINMTRHALIPLPGGLQEALVSSRGAGMLATACLVPLLGYVGFIVISLPLDLWRSLLGIPGKLDSLKR